jgi:hypothetical protein
MPLWYKTMNIKNRLLKLERQQKVDWSFCSCSNPHLVVKPQTDDREQSGSGCINCGKPFGLSPGAKYCVLVPTADGRGEIDL